jgi:hypothetical protein
MTEPEWRVRVAGESDRAQLAGFACADGKLHWFVEVEASSEPSYWTGLSLRHDSAWQVGARDEPTMSGRACRC